MCIWLLIAPFAQAVAEQRNQTDTTTTTAQDGQRSPNQDGQPQRFTRPPLDRTWEILKTWIHALNLLTSIPGVTISAYILAVFVQNPLGAPVLGRIGLPILFVSFIWNLFELTIRAKRRWMIGMLPNAHVLVDFIGALFHTLIFICAWADIRRRDRANAELNARTQQQQQQTREGGMEMEMEMEMQEDGKEMASLHSSVSTHVNGAAPALQAPMKMGVTRPQQALTALDRAEHAV